ncbi:MAG: sigma-54-dependent transcriptional regulator [Brevinema sp.]
MKKSILVIDDEENIRGGLILALKSEGYTVQGAKDGAEGLEKVAALLPDAIICDVKMPKMDGITLLSEIKRLHTHIPVIMLTGHAGLDDAVDAMKQGAYDFLTKPVHLEKLFLVLNRAFSDVQAKEKVQALATRLNAEPSLQRIVGESPIIHTLLEKTKQIASTDATVLLMGESGTGKELFASAIHENSLRAEEAFIKVNCGALPENLLESELFGHEKGAFTGATARRKGRFELADGGTIFLDEIGDISAAVQVKLLRVLQEREFERVGGEETIKVDIRVISATNKDLRKAVAEGTFREDLFYRLNVIQLDIPPLRDRVEDIPALADTFLKRYAEKYHKVAASFTPEVIQKMRAYSWPGNIRELQNAVETAVVLSSGECIEVEHLPSALS